MSFQEQLKRIRELSGLNENVKSLLERMTGKELVSYEGIDALVAALMGFYNVELKKKAPSSHTHGWGDVTGKPGSFPPSSHTHDDRYYTESEINEKFKNFCPYAVGDIYITTKSENPTSNWLGTTWQKIEGRFLLGTSNSQASKLTGGSMNKNISQANLPNVKLTVNSFSLGRGNMDITGTWKAQALTDGANSGSFTGALYKTNETYGTAQSFSSSTTGGIGLQASRSWTGTTNSVSPQTSSLGSGQALDITPAYYTCHMWLRTS